MKLAEIWVYLSTSPLLGLTVTLVAYLVAFFIYSKLNMNPLGLGLAVACAAALLLMFIGYGPIDRLTTSYARIYAGQANVAPAAPADAPGATSRPAQTAMAPQH